MRRPCVTHHVVHTPAQQHTLPHMADMAHVPQHTLPHMADMAHVPQHVLPHVAHVLGHASLCSALPSCTNT